MWAGSCSASSTTCAPPICRPSTAAPALFLLVLFILFRPQGLMGRVESARYDGRPSPCAGGGVVAVGLLLAVPSMLKSYGVYSWRSGR